MSSPDHSIAKGDIDGVNEKKTGLARFRQKRWWLTGLLIFIGICVVAIIPAVVITQRNNDNNDNGSDDPTEEAYRPVANDSHVVYAERYISRRVERSVFYQANDGNIRQLRASSDDSASPWDPSSKGITPTYGNVVIDGEERYAPGISQAGSRFAVQADGGRLTVFYTNASRALEIASAPWDPPIIYIFPPATFRALENGARAVLAMSPAPSCNASDRLPDSLFLTTNSDDGSIGDGRVVELRNGDGANERAVNAGSLAGEAAVGRYTERLSDTTRQGSTSYVAVVISSDGSNTNNIGEGSNDGSVGVWQLDAECNWARSERTQPALSGDELAPGTLCSDGGLLVWQAAGNMSIVGAFLDLDLGGNGNGNESSSAVDPDEFASRYQLGTDPFLILDQADGLEPAEMPRSGGNLGCGGFVGGSANFSVVYQTAAGGLAELRIEEATNETVRDPAAWRRVAVI